MAGKPRQYLPFEEARAIARAANLAKATDWFRWQRDNKPAGVPSRPDRVYQEFQSWTDWIGVEK